MKVVVQGQGEISLTQREFVASGGEVCMVYCKYVPHRPPRQQATPHMPQLRFLLQRFCRYQRQTPHLVQADLLSGMPTLQRSRTGGSTRFRGHQPRTDMPLLWQRVYLFGEAQQSGTPQGRMQFLPGCCACQTAKRPGHPIQGREMLGTQLRVQPFVRSSVLPPCRPRNQSSRHLQTHVRIMGQASGRARQMCAPLPELSR